MRLLRTDSNSEGAFIRVLNLQLAVIGHVNILRMALLPSMLDYLYHRPAQIAYFFDIMVAASR